MKNPAKHIGDVIAKSDLVKTTDDNLIPCAKCGMPFLTRVIVLTDATVSHETLCTDCAIAAGLCGECKRPLYRFLAMENGEVRERTRCFNIRCCTIADKENAEAKERASQYARTHFLQTIPATYRETDMGLLPLPAKYNEAVRFDLTKGRGLILRGDTGQGKTRAMYGLLTRAATEQGLNVRILTGNEFTNGASAAYSEGGEGQGWERALSNVDVLAFDDLGKGVFTERVVNTLFGIVERRTAAARPIVITTNEVRSTMTAKAKGDELMMFPIWRRLTEFCDVIEFI